MTTETTVQLGKKPRHQLRLPQPYFVVVDDWLEKLGEKSYLMWFKLLAKVDRTKGDKSTVTYTQAKLAKSLGISKPTLITHLKSLYEYGFIDYKEWKAPTGNTAENIIVYEAPQNDEANLSKELVKVRDWENRTNEKFDFTKKGGRPKKEATPAPKEEPKKVSTELNTNVNAVIKTEFDHFKQGMIDNNVDLDVVVKWVNKSIDTVPYHHICYVFQQLATWAEPIKKTASFITSTLKQVPTIHRPVTEPVAPKPERSEYARKVPFYNWLEEDGSKEIDNDDMPY